MPNHNPIFLGLSLEEFLNLMTTKKVVHFYHSEIRRLFMSFDRQCKFSHNVE